MWGWIETKDLWNLLKLLIFDSYFRDLLVIDWWKLLQRFIKFLSHPPPPTALRDTTTLRDTSKTTDDRTSLAFRDAKTSFLSETIAGILFLVFLSITV